MKAPLTIVGITLLIIVLLNITTLIKQSKQLYCSTLSNESYKDSTTVTASSSTTTAISGSTGTLFSGKVIRTFNGTTVFHNGPTSVQVNDEKKKFPILFRTCTQWAVVTTINPVSESVKSVASLQDWCLVIVGDLITPENYLLDGNLHNSTNVIYLNMEDQKQIINDFVQYMPTRSFARKNIGYLFAITHGAKILFDFDDDNVLLRPPPNNNDLSLLPYKSPDHILKKTQQQENLESSINIRYLDYNSDNNKNLPFNPLPLMHTSVPNTWPRGFPIERIKESALSGEDGSGMIEKLGTIDVFKNIGVIQAVCNDDPDVDAIYRLTRPLPFHFKTFEEQEQNTGTSSTSSSSLMIPYHMYTPYNAQATTHLYDSFWGLLLPYTVPGRVTDIWRSYFTQRIMKELNLVLIYTPPLVIHTRTPHNYIADLRAEDDLYQKTSALLQFLAIDFQPKSTTTYLPSMIEELTINLYERDYIDYNDVIAMQQWLKELVYIGYVFPKIVPENEKGIITLS